jgi:FtsZ-interacting cell division protein YlmF
MPGPGNQKKRNNKTKRKPNEELGANGSGQPQAAQTPLSQCQTLEEDEMTRCDQPATDGVYPNKERCKKHQTQYRLMYKKYKDAAKIVDELKNNIPDQAQIDQYKDDSKVRRGYQG